jgi:hypothetical protein
MEGKVSLCLVVEGRDGKRWDLSIRPTGMRGVMGGFT